MSVYTCVYIYIYIYTKNQYMYIDICIHIYKYKYISKECLFTRKTGSESFLNFVNQSG